jgi:peptidoglycan/xylan/chitin deacetylase (PgdA/CDA1 family)
LHSVPDRFANSFAKQVEALKRRWSFAAPVDLTALLEVGVERPTLLFCFDDGLANTVLNAAPVIESVGGRAIFAVPAAWPDVAPENREEWFRHHVYPVPTELHSRAGDITAPTWEKLRETVARGHEIWSHGVDHVHLQTGTPPDVLEREVAGSKKILEAQLGVTVRGYCPPMSYTVPPHALDSIAATYELAFGGPPAPVRAGVDRHRIPRANVEASWPLATVELQLSVVGDSLTRVLSGLRS